MSSKKPTDDELKLLSDYSHDHGTLAKNAIRAYVKADEPIPDELKPHLLRILNEHHDKFSGEDATATKWMNNYLAVCHYAFKHGFGVEEAIPKDPFKMHLSEHTLQKNFYEYQNKYLEATGSTFTEQLQSAIKGN